MSNKPTVFNYKDYKDALKRIEELEAENDRLWKENANLQIKCRILEDHDQRMTRRVKELEGES